MKKLKYQQHGFYKISYQRATALSRKFFNGAKLPSKLSGHADTELMFPSGCKLRYNRYLGSYMIICYTYNHNIELNELGIVAEKD